LRCRRCRRRGVEGQLGRRRVGRKGAHGVDAAHGQRVQALAQRGFQGRLPAGLDVQAGPQAGQAVQPVLRQPGLQLAFGLHLLLQRAQGLQPGADVAVLAALGIGRLLGRAALVFQRGHLGLQVLQAGVGHGMGLVGLGALGAQRLQPGQVGRGQAAALGVQALAAGAQGLALLVNAAALGRQHLDLLLHRIDLLALRVGAALGGAHRVFDIRQPHRLLFGLGGQDLGLLVGRGDLLGDGLQLGLGVVAALLPLAGLGLQVRQALLHPLAAVDHIADALFQPADLQRRLGQVTLGQMQLVAGGVVLLAHRLQRGFHMAQLGQARFQRIGGGADGLGHAGFFRRGVALLQEPQLVQLGGAGFLQGVVLRGHLGLLLQLVEVGVQLAQDVVDAGQVLARVTQAQLGLAAALLVLADAGGFFQEQPQFFRPRFDDAADGALADDGVGPRAQAGAQEHVLHVAPAHRLVVDEVAAGAVTRQHALDGDLGKLAPGSAGAGVFIAEHQLHAGAAGRLALAAAVEDDVLHALATQLAGLAFAQHPAHRVHDVGLAAAVGADHAHPLAGQLEGGGFGEGLEARELDLVQAHALLVCPGTAAGALHLPQVFDLYGFIAVPPGRQRGWMIPSRPLRKP
jgi:hypothetical protein